MPHKKAQSISEVHGWTWAGLGFQWQFCLMPFQVIGPHEGEAIPVENETDVDKKYPVARAPIKKFFFK